MREDKTMTRKYNYEFRTSYMELAEKVYRHLRINGIKCEVNNDVRSEQWVFTARMTARQKKTANDFIATLSDGWNFHRI